jgi:hydroxyacylglutathione hydrolase
MAVPLYLKQIELGPMENFVYLIGDPKTREALVVDPAWSVNAILKAADDEGYKINGALITHTHFDHINGLGELLNETDGVVYIHKNEAEFLEVQKSNIQKTDGGEKILIGSVEINFLHTPGHTPGSQCFLVGNHLISGDTLFINACGRCDLPGGSPEQMYHSLSRLADLDQDTILYPGHNYADEPTSTIGQEKNQNPYMLKASLDDFLKYRMG